MNKLPSCLLNAFLNVIVGHVVLCDVASQSADDDHSDDAREEEHNHNGVDNGEPVDLGVLQVTSSQVSSTQAVHNYQVHKYQVHKYRVHKHRVHKYKMQKNTIEIPAYPSTRPNGKPTSLHSAPTEEEW